ncbi:MAG: hypothetical protein MJE77_25855 [Proteobacteria bacterium]|nr:hypothetical protein [Pseudomonadota bacterium]
MTATWIESSGGPTWRCARVLLSGLMLMSGALVSACTSATIPAGPKVNDPNEQKYERALTVDGRERIFRLNLMDARTVDEIERSASARGSEIQICVRWKAASKRMDRYSAAVQKYVSAAVKERCRRVEAKLPPGKTGSGYTVQYDVLNLDGERVRDLGTGGSYEKQADIRIVGKPGAGIFVGVEGDGGAGIKCHEAQRLAENTPEKSASHNLS